MDELIPETWTFFDPQSRIQLILMTYGGGRIYKASYQGHEIPSNDVLLDYGEEREFNL
jgi:hypothetical protein